MARTRFARSLLALALAISLAPGAASGSSAARVARSLSLRPLANVGLPRLTGEATVGATLRASAGAWSLRPSSLAFRWLLCDGSGRRCLPISGEASPRLRVPELAAGRRVRVRVTAKASTGPARATSRPSSAVALPEAPAPQSDGALGGADGGAVLFEDRFDVPDGLITNEYSRWNPSSPQATLSSAWEVTSGSLFALGGAAWTGVPDGCPSSSAHSVPCTASDVFRLNTKEEDFGDVTVSMDLVNNYLTSSSRTPAVPWDGVHIWLRHQSEYSLYYASVNRRDGHLVLKKKCPGGTENGGTYYVLDHGDAAGHPIPFGTVQHVAAQVRDEADGSVALSISRDGERLVAATDTGVGCPPITAAGSVGVRGDNDDFTFDNFRVAQG